MSTEHDPSDPALDRLLRAEASALPPAALDAKILAAAHRAVASAPRSAEATRPWRWWMPLAAAATIGAIAIGVLQLVPSEHESAPAVVSDMPATTGAPANVVPAPAPAPSGQLQPSAPKVSAETAAPPAAAPVRKKASEPAAAPEPFPGARAPLAQESAPAPASPPAQESAQAPASPPPASAAGAPSAPAAKIRAESTRRDAGQSAAGAVDSAAAPALARSADKRDPQAGRADEFIARIRRLRSEGKIEEAAQALTAFRVAFADADARLPPDLRDWAASVRR